MAKRLRVGKFVGDTIRITRPTRIWWTTPRDGGSEDYTDVEVVGTLNASHLNVTGHTKDQIVAVKIGLDVTAIGNQAFSGCSGMTGVTIPDSVTSIGQLSFSDCSGLTSVTIPGSVTNIDSLVFFQCYNLETATLCDGITSVGSNMFRRCSKLSHIEIPISVRIIDGWAFCECYGLSSVVIPYSVTTIGESAFGDCRGLTSVTIGNGVTSIRTRAFYNCYKIAVLDFHNHQSVPQLANTDAFYNTPSTKKIVVPDNLYDTWKTATNWSSTTNNIVSSIVKYSDYINT